jgi:dTDP-4-dehydrorhamnose reductase
VITLFGHGYIGQHIAAELDKQNIKYQWLSHKSFPVAKTGVIINAAGYTGVPNVDTCEIKKQETIDGNVMFPLRLEFANPYSRIIHITSGCVYTGYKEGGWTEYDRPNFDFNNGSFYSGSKALFQSLMIPELVEKSYLLRIRLPFGDQHTPKNYLTKLSKYDKLVDFENSVSYVNDVAKTAVFFSKNLPEPGIYNVCNPGTITTKQVADMMGLKKEWYTEEEFNAAVKAPRSNCNMSSEKLNSIFPIQDAVVALEQAIGKLK